MTMVFFDHSHPFSAKKTSLFVKNSTMSELTAVIYFSVQLKTSQTCQKFSTMHRKQCYTLAVPYTITRSVRLVNILCILDYGHRSGSCLRAAISGFEFDRDQIDQ